MAKPLPLFPEAPVLPPEMRYQTDLISAADETALLRFIATLTLKPFEFSGGFKGNRLIQSFGWRYDYTAQKLGHADDIPPALQSLRQRCAEFAVVAAHALEQALITEYPPGAGIGWHRDKPMFGDVIGVSLATPCIFRLRRKQGDKWERVSFEAAPRSAYLLRGPARTTWEHSIPAVEERRYSVTFRTFKPNARR